ncbi:MAG: hypothetical protein BWY70_01994 [Bacteroidetes bacterium ADurb.Bin408]|nr:MAG: hypothetical protein BWY70_01994 [Bacteroidetes bacterium ADurb.Bin408]
MHRLNIRGKYGRMRTCNILLLFLLLSLLSCEKDPLINGNCSQTPPGMLCKTYFFENDQCIGYIEHYYDSAYRERNQIYRNPKGRNKMKVTFSYNASGLLSVKHVNKEASGNTESTLYVYNSNSTPLREEYYANGTLLGKKEFFFTDSLLTGMKVYYNNEPDSIITLEYDTDHFLWRKSIFNSDSTLMAREIHSFYENNIERIDLYDAFNVFRGYQLLHSDSNGNLLTNAHYKSDQTLTEMISYTYSAGKPERITFLDALGKVKSYTAFFYN